MQFTEFRDRLLADTKFETTEVSDQELLVKTPYGKKQTIKMPLLLSPELSILAGFIIGDGHLKKSKYAVITEVTDYQIAIFIVDLFKKIFDLDLTLKMRQRTGKQDSYVLKFESKPIWSLFTMVLEIPSGKKSFIVKVPEIVLQSDLESKRGFLSGLFLADGGIKKHSSISFTTCSRQLSEGVEGLLKDFLISYWKSEWISKISNKYVFDLIIRKRDSQRFEYLLPLTKLKLQRSPSLVNGAS